MSISINIEGGRSNSEKREKVQGFLHNSKKYDKKKEAICKIFDDSEIIAVLGNYVSPP